LKKIAFEAAKNSFRSRYEAGDFGLKKCLTVSNGVSESFFIFYLGRMRMRPYISSENNNL